jgi:hypothetical protein
VACAAAIDANRDDHHEDRHDDHEDRHDDHASAPTTTTTTGTTTTVKQSGEHHSEPATTRPSVPVATEHTAPKPTSPGNRP